MPILHAIVLGIVQGLAEFLPISSSGHLRIVPWLLGWDDFAGRRDLKQAFDVALHLGTLVGAAAYFRHELVELGRGGLSALRPATRQRVGSVVETGVDPAPGPQSPSGDEGRLAWLLLATAVPAGVVGLLFNDQLGDVADHEWLIGVLLVVFGLVLLQADRMGGDKSADRFTFRDALLVGGAQALALVPGVSRSGATITAARGLRYSRDAAARLSFLMSLPVIAGALVVEGAEVAVDGVPAAYLPAVAWGIVASGVTGYLAVWGTLRLVRTRTFTPFVVYRVVVGVAVVVIAATSLR